MPTMSENGSYNSDDDVNNPMIETTTTARIPLAVWPDSAPHVKEEYFVTVLCGEMQFRWALHEGSTTDFFPTLFWRTSSIKEEELDDDDPCHMLDRYWPKAALSLLYGEGPVPHTKERASCFRAGLRIPAMSIYCVFHTDGNEPGIAERGIQYMFRDIPCNLHKLSTHDFPGFFHTGHSSLNTEQMATVKAVGRLFPDRPGLIIDGNANMTLTATRLGTTLEKSQPEDSQRPDLDAGIHDAPKDQMKSGTLCSGILSHCQTTSISGKLHALHKETAALPEISTKQVQDVLHNVSEKGLVPIFATNTIDAMITCALQETLLYLRSAIREWAFSTYAFNPVRSSKSTKISLQPMTAENESTTSDDMVEVEDWQSLPFVCLTGMEADLLKRLLTGNNIVKTQEDSWTWYKHSQKDNPSDDSIFLRILGESGDFTFVEVKTHRHLAFHGIADILVDVVRDRIEKGDAEENLRQDILGCRFAKDFGEIGIFRGHVQSYDRENQLFKVRYDDGDIEEFEIGELYLHLKLYTEVSGGNGGQRESLEVVNKKRESLKVCKLMEKVFPSLLEEVQSPNIINDEKSPHDIVGSNLIRDTGEKGIQHGKVLSYHKNDGLFKVKFDNNDGNEFLSIQDLQPLLQCHDEISDSCTKEVETHEKSSKSLSRIQTVIAKLASVRRNKRSEEFQLACQDVVGCSVAKDFKNYGIFRGKVVSFDRENRLFKVIFEDGDAEECDTYEIGALLEMYINIMTNGLVAKDCSQTKKQARRKNGNSPKSSSTVRKALQSSCNDHDDLSPGRRALQSTCKDNDVSSIENLESINATVPPTSYSRKRVHVESGVSSKLHHSPLKKMYDPNSFLGHRVGRMFGKTLYFGTIENFIIKRNKHHMIVRYDDGQTEEYKIDLIEKLLREYKDFHTENDPESFRTRRIAKIRNGTVHYGTVEGYQLQPSHSYLWSIRYDDGTTKSIDQKQFNSIIKRYPVEFAANDPGPPRDVKM